MTSTHPDTTATVNEIDRARQELAHTLFLLGDRIAPKKVVARAKERVRFLVACKKAELNERYSPVQIVRRKLQPVRVIDVPLPKGAVRQTNVRGALPR